MIFARPSRSSSSSGPEPSRGSRKTPCIAVTGFRGIPATWGGVEHQCEEIYTRLASRGYRVTVYARSHYVREGLQTYKGVTVKRFWTLNTKYTEAILHTLFSVLHILGSNPEIVHLYSQGPCLFIPLVKLFRPRTRVFFTCVGLDWKRKKWPGWASRIIRLGELFSARFPHHHITVSRELQDYYRAEYGVKAFCIPNGVNTPDGVPLEEVEHHSLQPRGYFLFVGRLVPEKRVEDLIRAFLVKPRRSRLVIAGDAAGTEDYVRYLRSIAATSPSVLFVGYQYGRALGALYSNARAFVTTSELEGMPLTLLEALSHGLFCLASDIPPHREVLEGTTHSLFPVGSVKTLSSLLDQLDTMESLRLNNYGIEARNHVATHFSWDVVVDQLEDLYVRSVAVGKLTGAAPW